MIEEQGKMIVGLKTDKVENESTIAYLEEKKATLERDVALKNKVVAEIEQKLSAT
jgi:hypothetical protein